VPSGLLAVRSFASPLVVWRFAPLARRKTTKRGKQENLTEETVFYKLKKSMGGNDDHGRGKLENVFDKKTTVDKTEVFLYLKACRRRLTLPVQLA